MRNARLLQLVGIGLALRCASGCHHTASCPAPTVPTASGIVDPAIALEEVGHGHRTLFSLGDSAIGLVVVLNRTDPSGEDPAADAEGRIREARRACGAGDPSLARVTENLARHYEPDFDYVPVVCDGLVCEAHGPMEFATSLRFVFERTASGGIALRQIFEVEDVAMIDEYVHAAWNWAESAAADVPSRCSQP